MTFFIILIIIFLFGWIFSRLAPYILVRWINKSGNQAASSSNRRYADKEEGDVYISRKAKPEEKVMDRDMGEYVDYEEMKEDEK